MWKEFKEFALRGSVVDLAVGVIIGGAFGKIVSSLVNDILMPPLGFLIGGLDFSARVLTLHPPIGSVKPVEIRYGLFANNVIDFAIMAFCIFLLVKGMNSLKRDEPTVPPTPTEKKCPECAMVIPLEAKRCGHCASLVS